MRLVQVHHHTGDRWGCAVQAQPYAAHAFVHHRNLLLLCLRQGVGQIKNQPVGVCCHGHAWTATDGCAQRDFHAQIVRRIAYNFQTPYRGCARRRGLRSSPRCQQQQNSELFSCPHSQASLYCLIQFPFGLPGSSVAVALVAIRAAIDVAIYAAMV